MLRRGFCSRPGSVSDSIVRSEFLRVQLRQFVVAAAFLASAGGLQCSLNAADDAKTAGVTPAARSAKTVAASSSPSAPLPRVQKKVSDFGSPEVALINAA